MDERGDQNLKRTHPEAFFPLKNNNNNPSSNTLIAESNLQ